VISLLWRIVKTSLIAFIGIIASHLLRWNGKSLSDRIQVEVAHSEQSGVVSELKKWGGEVTTQVRYKVLSTRAKLEKIDKDVIIEEISPREKLSLDKIVKKEK